MKHLALLAVAFMLIGCPDDGMEKIEINGHSLNIEIADERDEWTQGLMNRKELPEDQGMLFIFPNVEYKSFWMHDTLIPLSIAYIDDGGIIVDILDMTPLDETGVPSSKPVQFALEVNRGYFQRHGIQVGDRVEIPQEWIP